MDGESICTGPTSCVSLVIIVSVLLIGILFNYMVQCIPVLSFQPDPNSLSLPTTTAIPPNTPLPEHHPSFRHLLKSIPAAAYDAAVRPRADGFERETCAVCLAEFEDGERVRVLPSCKHVYHVECIDSWLLRSLHCPVCRERVVDRQSFPKVLMESRRIDVRRNNTTIASFVLV